MVILLNCVTLGMYQPCENIDCTSDRCQILQVRQSPVCVRACKCVRTTCQCTDEEIEQNDQLFDINSEQLTTLLLIVPQAVMPTNTAARIFPSWKVYIFSCSLNRELGLSLF